MLACVDARLTKVIEPLWKCELGNIPGCVRTYLASYCFAVVVVVADVVGCKRGGKVGEGIAVESRSEDLNES